MYTVCYTGACVHERHQIITINRIHFTLAIALFSVIYVQYGLIMGDFIFFWFFFFFSYKIRYGKQDIPLRTMLSLSCLCVWDLTDVWSSNWLSLFFPSPVISTSFLPFLPVKSTGAWMPETAHAACGRGGHTARSLPKQLICIFKRQLPTQQNKTLQPLKSASRMVFVPRYGFGCARTSPQHNFGKCLYVIPC